jgi:hypothetical protein
MAVVADHMNQKRTRQRSYATGGSAEPVADDEDASSEFNDDFDMAAYQSKLNSDIAQQAARLKQRESTTTEQQQKILLVLLGRREGDHSLPEGWEKPLGLNVFSKIALSKMREEFQRKKDYKGEVILAWKGIRLRHGTPKDIGMTDQSRIGMLSWGEDTDVGRRIFRKIMDISRRPTEEIRTESYEEKRGRRSESKFRG